MGILKEYDLEGRVAIVTGAGRGIGKGIALTLAEAGANIIAVSRSGGEIQGVAREISHLGGKSLAIPTDVTDGDQVQKMVDQVIAEFGKIDILVNNAGVGIEGSVVKLPHLTLAPMNAQDWHTVLNTNLTAPLLCCQSVGPHMIGRKKGKIINVTSANAVRAGLLYNTGYCASKAGLAMFTRKLAWEWARYGINVNAIGPGPIKTELSKGLYAPEAEKLVDRILSQVPFRKFGEPRDVGLLAVYLASDASDYMTGQNIYIDGGFTGSG